MSEDVRAIDAVVNIWTPEALAHRPGWGPGFFVGKMNVDPTLMDGLSLEQLIERMDQAGIERGFLIAHKSGRPGLPGCYHLPYEPGGARGCEAPCAFSRARWNRSV